MNFETSDQDIVLFSQQQTEDETLANQSGRTDTIEPLEVNNQSSEDEIILQDSSPLNREIIGEGSFDSIFDPLLNDDLSEPTPSNQVINGLLTPVDASASPETLSSNNDPTIIRQQLVEINFGLLETAADQSPQNQSFQLNLFDDISYTVNFGPAQTSSDGESFVRVGKVEEMPLSEVILVSDKDENVVVANIRVADPLQQQDEFYQIRYEGNGFHSIREIDSSEFPACPNCGGQHPASLHQDSVVPEEQEDIDPNAPIPLGVDTSDLGINGVGVANAQAAEAEMDVLVVYSPAARIAEGGTTAMNTLITLAETETNLGYQNSQVDQRVNIVHREEIAYTETASNPFGNALTAVRLQTDGIMDNVHSLRDTHSADFVSLWIDAPGSCGIAYLMTNPSVGFESWAFSVVDKDCATGNFTFAHELGHNQGSAHNIENAGSAAFNYSYGYRDTSLPDRFRTIMSYDNGTGLPRINYWSNPNVNYNGEVTGTSSANNALSLNNTDQYASWWRVSNDNFAKAKEISGSSASGYAFTQTATKESGEPNHAGNSGGNSAWWEWTAASSGDVTIDTNGSDFNTTLGVYTGSSVSSLSTIASDDDGGSGTNSQVTFSATAGTTYYIAIDGYNGAFGNASLNLTNAPISTDVDLSGAYFDVVQEPLTAGETFDVDFEIQNTEAGDAGDFWADFYLSEDASVSSDDFLLDYERISGLAGNSTTGILGYSLTLPDASDAFWSGNGTYYIGMISDAFDEVAETDETNNASIGDSIDYDTVQITVTQPTNTVDNDFDGDGKADIHWRNGSDNQVWLMDGTTRLAQGNLSSTSWNAEGNGDFNGDGVADLLFTNGSQYEIWEMDGTTEVNTYSFTALDSNWSVVGIGDTDGDGDDDILARNGNANRILEIDNFDLDGVVTLNGYNSSWSVAGVGDTDGDGDDDILWRKNNANRIWEIQNNSRVSNINIGGFNSSWSVAGLGDTDGDGDEDILWRKNNANRIWEIQNNSRVSNINIGGFNSTWNIEDVEDYDGDGDADILWRKGNKNKIWEIQNNAKLSNTNTNNLNSAWEVIA